MRRFDENCGGGVHWRWFIRRRFVNSDNLNDRMEECVREDDQ